MGLGKRLLSFRAKHDLTQEEVADRLNVKPETVSRWETGQKMSKVNCLRVLEFLDGRLPENETLTGKVLRFRMREGISQTELAKRVGVYVEVIKRVESGRKPNKENRQKIESVLSSE